MERCQALDARYAGMLAQMGVDSDHHPLAFGPVDDGGQHLVPQDDGGWLLRVTERGRTCGETRFTGDDDLLYRLACDVAAAEGSRWQARQPASGRDPRRADFARRLELVGRVSPLWRDRLAMEIAQWLVRNPYADGTPDAARAKRPRKGVAGLVVVALLAAAWAGAHVPLWRAWEMQARIERTGRAMRAEVVGRHRTDGRFGDVYSVDFAYAFAGKDRIAGDTVDWATWRALEPSGSRVDILVDPAEPDDAIVSGNDRAGRLALIYAAIDALLALVILRGWMESRKAGAGE